MIMMKSLRKADLKQRALLYLAVTHRRQFKSLHSHGLVRQTDMRHFSL